MPKPRLLKNPADLLGDRLETTSSNTLMELENFWPEEKIYKIVFEGVEYIGRKHDIQKFVSRV